MKHILLVLLIAISLFASQRPKIALVLSGGGARGGAHVGVIEVLEKNHIPIDMIVGTSMGSFVGGLYASGKTTDEMKKILTETNWKKYITTDFNRQDIPMMKKDIEYIYNGRLGVGVDANDNIVLPTGVLKREPLLLKFLELTSNVKDIKDFDKLNIPYRAVATNIKNGESVILKSGVLGEAIYASSAIPGGLQPINIDGVDLVDGGVSDNIPIQVARDMGADIIIAVDVSEGFPEKVDVNSYFVVVGQLVNILMRKNADKSISTLTQKDILITPDLKGYGGLDADKYAQIIKIGYDATIKIENKLKKLSIDKERYKKYQQTYRTKHYTEDIIINEIRIKNKTYISDKIIREQITQKVGQKFDDKALIDDIVHLYNMTIFDSVNYELTKEDGKNILIIKTKPSWNNHGDILFGLSLSDDFKGHSSYNLKLGYLMYGVNSLGAQWRSDFEIGDKQRAYTEFYQPLDYHQSFYLKPFLSYENITYIVPTDSLGNQELESTGCGGGVGAGININNNFKVEFDGAMYSDRSKIELFEYDEKFISKQLKLTFLYDSLDNYNFPNKGFFGLLKLKKDSKAWGSDYDYEQYYIDIEKPFNYKNNILVFKCKYGHTDVKSLRHGQITVYDKFYLGGLFNLSGYQPYTFVSNDMLFGYIKYRYRLKNGGFFGSLGVPMYAGATFEGGNSWSHRQNLNNERTIYAGSAFLAADTPFGALHFAYGYADRKHESLYFYLGEKF